MLERRAAGRGMSPRWSRRVGARGTAGRRVSKVGRRPMSSFSAERLLRGAPVRDGPSLVLVAIGLAFSREGDGVYPALIITNSPASSLEKGLSTPGAELSFHLNALPLVLETLLSSPRLPWRWVLHGAWTQDESDQDFCYLVQAALRQPAHLRLGTCTMLLQSVPEGFRGIIPGLGEAALEVGLSTRHRPHGSLGPAPVYCLLGSMVCARRAGAVAVTFRRRCRVRGGCRPLPLVSSSSAKKTVTRGGVRHSLRVTPPCCLLPTSPLADRLAASLPQEAAMQATGATCRRS